MPLWDLMGTSAPAAVSMAGGFQSGFGAAGRGGRAGGPPGGPAKGGRAAAGGGAAACGGACRSGGPPWGGPDGRSPCGCAAAGGRLICTPPAAGAGAADTMVRSPGPVASASGSGAGAGTPLFFSPSRALRSARSALPGGSLRRVAKVGSLTLERTPPQKRGCRATYWIGQQNRRENSPPIFLPSSGPSAQPGAGSWPLQSDWKRLTWQRFSRG
jgi:hypothetical protein